MTGQIQLQRKSVNPSLWGLKFEMDQAEILEGAQRRLQFSGQISVAQDDASEIGLKILHANDMRMQIKTILQNIETILGEANFSKKDLCYMRFYTTDVDDFLSHYDVYADWIKPAGIRPPQTLLGVSRLVLPELKIEIEALAVQ